MIRCISLVAGAGLLAAGAAAQDAVWETDMGAEYALVLAPDAPDARDGGQSALYELGVWADAAYLFDNGVEAGVSGALRAQRDAPARAGFSGCLGQNFPDRIEIGGFSGLNAACAPEDIGPRGSLERAYVFLNGGYGEVVLGRDLGVAARFAEGPQTVFSHARIADPLLDPRAAGAILTRADVTGPAEKVTYTTPRLLGLRAGLSFTPEADVRGLDRDPARSFGGGVAQARLENVWEVGLNLSRRLPERGVRVRAGAGYARAEVEPRGPGMFRDSMETWSLGAELEGESLSAGAAWLTSDNGVIGGRYEAWRAGVSARRFGLDWSLTVADARDDLADLDANSVSFGVGWTVFDALGLRAGYQWQDLDSADGGETADGLVLEITQSF